MGDAYRCEVTLDGLPAINTARNQHWRLKKRHDDAWKFRLRTTIHRSDLPDEPLKRCRLTCIRRSARQPDYDNLCQSFKPLVDSLIGEVIVDDSMDVIVERDYRWAPAKRGEGSVTLIVEEV